MRTFESELAQAQDALLSYLYGLSGGDLQVAEELRGRVNLVLLRKQEQYDVTRPFLPWARAVAGFEYKHWITAQQRDRLAFSEETAALLAEVPAPDELEAPRERMLQCLDAVRKELTPEQNTLLTRYYEYRESLREIGSKVNRTPASLERSLVYLRKLLRKKVEQMLKDRDKE